MADQKLTDKTELTTPADNDLLEIVDVSDTTDSPEGTTKKIQKSNVAGATSYLGLNDTADGSYVGKEGFAPLVETSYLTDPPSQKLKLTKIPTFQDLAPSGNFIITGGVIYTGSLNYYVWATSYVINGVQYDIAISDTVTLSNGDATNDRFDVFAIQISTLTDPVVPSVVVIEGTPAASPVKPTVDLTNQVEVSFRLVEATATTDGNATVELIYDENTGEPTEWANTNNPTGGNLANATDPYLGTVSFSVPAITGNDYVEWTNATEYDYSSSETLNFAIKIGTATGLVIPRIQIKLINSTSTSFWILNIPLSNLSNYGFDPAITAWQLIQIRLSDFVTTSAEVSYDVLEMRFYDTPAIDLDWISIQGNIIQPEPIAGETTYRAELVLTAAEIIAAPGTTSYPIIPALGAGFVIVPTEVIAIKDLSTTAFDCGNHWYFTNQSTTQTAPYKWWAYEINSIQDNIYKLNIPSDVLYNSTLIENAPFSLYILGTAQPTVGTSKIKVIVYYQILKL